MYWTRSVQWTERLPDARVWEVGEITGWESRDEDEYETARYVVVVPPTVKSEITTSAMASIEIRQFPREVQLDA